MSPSEMNLPRMENVRVVSGLYPKIMEIADPPSELYRKLDLNQLIQVAAVGWKLQEKLIAADIERLKVEQEALGEMQKLVRGFGK